VKSCVLAPFLHRARAVALHLPARSARALEREADPGYDVPGVVLARSLDRGAAGGDTSVAHRSDEVEREYDETHGDDREADCVE
jgi:hypothetical protein